MEKKPPVILQTKLSSSPQNSMYILPELEDLTRGCSYSDQRF